MPSANDMRKGMCIKYNGDIVVVLDFQHRTPGNLRAFVQATLRSIKTGKTSVVRFNSNEPLEIVPVEHKQMEFSYKDGAGYHFMDPETYEMLTLQEEFVGDAKKYLTENLRVEIMFTNNQPAQINLPPSVNLKIVESPEGVRGDTASNVTKPAVLETGITVNVPLFIKEGEVIKVSTITGEYLGRA
jgi:elongation factor P